MKNFTQFAGWAAVMTGVLSVVYAVLFLIVTRADVYIGTLGSWVVLGVSGLLAMAAVVGLYEQFKMREPGFALYALLLGALASFAMLQHGAYEAVELVRRGSVSSVLGAPSQVDAAGLASFGVMGLATFAWSWLMLRANLFPRNLARVGMLNAVLLVILFVATVFGSQLLILLSGGLTSVIVGPIWWIWLGRELGQVKSAAVREPALAR